jgi:hypothetical protein
MSCFRSPKSAPIVLLLLAASAMPALAGASLDIRPSVCPNLVHRYQPGILVAALVSDVDFVISYRDIDISSLRLRRADGLGGSVRPIYFRRNFLIDVAAPAESNACSTFGVDGMVDLRLFFGQVRLVSALDLGDFKGSLDVCLSGRTSDGTAFNACDQITMVGSKIRTLPGTDDDDLRPLP